MITVTEEEYKKVEAEIKALKEEKKRLTAYTRRNKLQAELANMKEDIELDNTPMEEIEKDINNICKSNAWQFWAFVGLWAFIIVMVILNISVA